MLANGCNPLLLPAQILILEQLPKLGSGKTDFNRAKQLTLQKSDARSGRVILLR